MTTTQSLSPFGGCCLQGGALQDLQSQSVWDLFQRHGLLVFRGYQVSSAVFYAFGAKFSRSFLIDPSPERVSIPSQPEVQTVTAGTGALNLHYEYGSTPFRPDMIWFLCVRPARQLGATIVCSGAEIWKNLSSASQALLERQRLMYFAQYEEDDWRKFFSIRALGQEGFDQLHMRLQGLPGLSYKLSNSAVVTRYVAPAVTTLPDGTRVLAGNVLPGVYKNVLPLLEDGSPIPTQILDEIREAAMLSLISLHWQPGDFAMVDNRRWLHGRESFDDPQRLVLTMTCFGSTH